MKGTEKQIAWATDIKATIIDIINTLIADGERCAANPNFAAMQSQINAKMEALNAQKSAIESCDSAKDIIDCFSGIKAGDLKAFIARCRVHNPQNDTQKRILG